MLLFFLLISAVGFSQADSAYMIDTTMNEEEEHDSDSSESEVADYFIKKSDYNNQETVQPRHVPDSLVAALKNNDAFWYANAEKEKKKPEQTNIQPKESWIEWLMRQQWFKVVIWIIIIGAFVAVLVWYLAVSNVSIFRRKAKVISGEEAGFEDENIFEINYQKEIENAIRAKNYRIAVRLMFLRLLKSLAEKELIQYKQERTNLDYMLQLHSSDYYKDFFRLARNYEYTWYGKFDVSPDAFTVIKNDFDNFDRKMMRY